MRPAIALTGIVILAFTACQKTDPKIPARAISARELLDRLHAARGNVVVMNLWATWCAPCISETPELVKFYNDAKNVKFFSVSVDHPDTIEERVLPFLKEKGVPFPVYVLKERSPDAVQKTLNLEWEGGVPATFVFDKSGQVKKSWDTDITEAQLTEAVKPLL